MNKKDDFSISENLNKSTTNRDLPWKIKDKLLDEIVDAPIESETCKIALWTIKRGNFDFGGCKELIFPEILDLMEKALKSSLYYDPYQVNYVIVHCKQSINKRVAYFKWIYFNSHMGFIIQYF